MGGEGSHPSETSLVQLPRFTIRTASSANAAVMGSNNANKHADERGWEDVGHVSDGMRVRRDPGRRMGFHEEVEKAQLSDAQYNLPL
jgi:hypothetical protein